MTNKESFVTPNRSIGIIVERFYCIAICLVAVCFVGCIPGNEREVVVYCALDKEFSEPILSQFESESGIKVLTKFDQESNKTVGLANEILQLADQQRCDLFWNNEILHTLRLKKAGLLDVYASPLAKHYPKSFVSKDSDWYGFAARARVFIINTDLLPEKGAYPTSVFDLADPRWKDRCCLAKPFFGTTATQAAVFYSQLGSEKADAFFEAVSMNAGMESGNKQVAIAVSRGRYAFGLTDTDDAIIEIEQGNPVSIVFPDQNEDQLGTLFIPNTLCITKGPNRESARKLLDYLLRKSVEEQLAQGPSAQIPLNAQSQIKSRVEPEQLRVMQVDFEAAAAAWENAKLKLSKIFPL